MSSLESLKITNLTKNYGSFTAVKDVSFSVGKGEIFGLLGPNGAGKTSIISCLMTLQAPSNGKVEIFGLDPQKDPVKTKLLTGFVPQELVNHGYFDVEEILEFHSGYFRKWNNKERLDYLLNRLGLWEHRKKKVKALSGGMKRRLLIAKALVHEPKLLLLDEPTAGVDIELRNSLWEFVGELKEQGVSVLLTTHYLEEAEQLCDRVGVLQLGELKTIGGTADLIKKLTNRKLTVELNNKKIKTFNIPYNKNLGQVLEEEGIKLNDLQDMKIHEGSLEEAVMQVLGGSSER